MGIGLFLELDEKLKLVIGNCVWFVEVISYFKSNIRYMEGRELKEGREIEGG